MTFKQSMNNRRVAAAVAAHDERRAQEQRQSVMPGPLTILGVIVLLFGLFLLLKARETGDKKQAVGVILVVQLLHNVMDYIAEEVANR